MMKGLSEEFLTIFLVLIVSMLAQFSEAQMVSFLINCGTNSSVDIHGRRWIGDTDTSDSNITLSSSGVEASTTIFHGDPKYAPLYKTARIFTESFNYTLRVSKGSYFLRLHYHPFSFRKHNANDSYFAVEANGLKLVSKFNVAGEILNKNRNLVRSGGNSSYFHLMKEYTMYVDGSVIVVSFVPLKGSFGFVNAIELIPNEKMLVDLARRVGGDASLKLDGKGVGIQTMYRLNVGGASIRPSQDSPLWRSWEADWSYMINSDAGSETRNTTEISYSNADVAPLVVYETARALSNAGVMEKRFNMSWKLEIDPDFEYLIRLHFCEFVFEEANQRNFRIYIDNKTAADHFDIYTRANGTNKAYYEDYVDSISEHSNHIWIQLGPETTSGSGGTDALLNGLEVFKISKNNNLAYVEKYTNLDIKKSKSFFLWVGIGAGVAFIAFLAAICVKFSRFSDKKKKPYLHANSSSYQSQNTQFGRRFNLTEIKVATNNFDESLVIGEGGFGKVYKGRINDNVLVAIKRSDPQSQQGLSEFETEIQMLSKLRHRHLVSLIGFCDEQSEMVLVYEFMANGTLRSHLFGGDLPPLSWKQRLEICIGAARGLHYLHTGLDRVIIHRDVKTTNILLDHHLFAKMSDFGISKTGPELDHTHVSTAVKGSFGYLDPEYFRMQRLTEKSDVYSFGVVLFEVMCARAVIEPELPKDQISLPEWALRMQRERSIECIVDERIKRGCDRESVVKFGEIAEKCVKDEGRKRPTMGEVLWHLENVLVIHDAWLSRDGRDDTSIAIGDESNLQGRDEEDGGEDRKVDPFDPMVVGIDDFSQMIRLQGR